MTTIHTCLPTWKLREDASGDGRFASPRHANGKSFLHLGFDLQAKPGTIVTAPCDGEIVGTHNDTMPSGARRNDVLILPAEPLLSPKEARFSFILRHVTLLPELFKRDEKGPAMQGIEPIAIKKGDRIGTVDDIKRLYKNKMTNHVHIGLYWNQRNRWMNPVNYMSEIPKGVVAPPGRVEVHPPAFISIVRREKNDKIKRRLRGCRP